MTVLRYISQGSTRLAATARAYVSGRMLAAGTGTTVAGNPRSPERLRPGS